MLTPALVLMVLARAGDVCLVQQHGRLGTWFHTGRAGVRFESGETERTPELESPGDAPKDVRHPKGKPRTIVPFGTYRSIQVNTDALGNNIPGDAANEPSICMDAANQGRMAIGWRQFDSVRSNFRQAGNAYTTDRGATWHSNTVLTKGTFRSDPVLVSEGGGLFFYNSLLETFYDDVFGTSTAGAAWKFLGHATGGDKQWMTVDSTNSIGRGNLYQCWSTAGNNYNGRQFSRSTNGGLNWSDPINIPGSPIWGSLDVDSSGNLFLCGLGDSGFECVRSSNAKDKNSSPTFDQVTPVDLGGSIVFGAFLNPGGLAGQSWIAIDRSAGPTSGDIYMLCSAGVDANNPCDVNFARSTDGGKTFSKFRRLNDDAPNTGAFHWFGTLAVAPGGRIDACWMDNRSAPLQPVSALFFSSSNDGGLTWTRNVQVTPTFDSTVGFPNQNKIGDYLTVASDATGANVAFSATFNSEEDIYYVHIPVGAGNSVDASAVATYQGTYASGTLSNIWTADGTAYRARSQRVGGLGDLAAMQADFVVPKSQVSALGFKARVSTGVATTGMCWLYNWNARRYDLLGAVPVSGSGYADLTFSLSQPAAPYLDATGRVRAVFRALHPAATGTKPFALAVDLFQLRFG